MAWIEWPIERMKNFVEINRKKRALDRYKYSVVLIMGLRRSHVVDSEPRRNQWRNNAVRKKKKNRSNDLWSGNVCFDDPIYHVWTKVACKLRLSLSMAFRDGALAIWKTEKPTSARITLLSVKIKTHKRDTPNRVGAALIASLSNRIDKNNRSGGPI